MRVSCGNTGSKAIQSNSSLLWPSSPSAARQERKIRGRSESRRHRETERKIRGRSTTTPPVSPPPPSKSPFPFPSSSKNAKHKTLIPFSFFLQPTIDIGSLQRASVAIAASNLPSLSLLPNFYRKIESLQQVTNRTGTQAAGSESLQQVTNRRSQH